MSGIIPFPSLNRLYVGVQPNIEPKEQTYVRQSKILFHIDRLSEYMASTGKRYQNHAATIRRWAAEDRKKAAPPIRNRDYSVKEDETV